MKHTKRRNHLRRFIVSSFAYFSFYLLLTVIIPPTFLGFVNFVSDNHLTLTGENQLTVSADFYSYLIHPVKTLKTLCSVVEYKQAYLVLQGSLTLYFAYKAVIVWFKVKPHKVEDGSDYGSHGTSRWAEEKEIIKDKMNFMSDFKNDKDFGTLIGKTPYSNEYIIRKLSSSMNNHTLVVAGSGKGKTQAYALLQIFKTKFQTLVMSDAKGELYRKTSKQKQREGFKILFLDFIKFSGNQWNPIADMLFDEIDNFSSNLVSSGDDDSNNIWGGHATNLISACIAYVLENLSLDRQHMGVVRRLMTLGEEELKEQFEQLPDDSVAKEYFQDVNGISGEAWKGIVATATNATRFWKQRRIQHFTAKSDFKFTDLGTEKVALYIRVHPTDETFRPLVNTFFTQMINRLIEEVDQFGGRYPVNIKFVWDEFTGLGKINPFQPALAFVRGLGIGIEIIVQDTAQLEKLYGKEDTRSIISNCDNFIFLGTNEESTATLISKKLGPKTIFIRNEQGKASTLDHSKDNLGHQSAKRDLLNATEVLFLDESEGIYFASGKPPIKFKKIFAYDLYSKLTESPLNWHLPKVEMSVFDKNNQSTSIHVTNDGLHQSIVEDMFNQASYEKNDAIERTDEEELIEKITTKESLTLPY